MKRLGWMVFGALSVVAGGVLATPGVSDSVYGLIERGAAIAAGSGGAISGDSCLFDNNGVQCAYPTTDVAPSATVLSSHSASPLGSTNKTGSNLQINAGWPTLSSTAVQANCGAADTFVITGQTGGVYTTKTCTRHATTNDATNFTCGSTNAEMATNVAACLGTYTGVASCANAAGCTKFTGVDGTFYLYPDATEPSAWLDTLEIGGGADHGVVTLGTEGLIALGSSLRLHGHSSTTLPALHFDVTGATNTGFNHLSGDSWRFVVDGSAALDLGSTITFRNTAININVVPMTNIAGQQLYSTAGVVAADATTFDPDAYTYWLTSANAAPTALTDFTTPTPGQMVMLCGGSATNSTTIADSGNFNLSGAMTLGLDDCIMLFVQADNDYIELWRVNN